MSFEGSPQIIIDQRPLWIVFLDRMRRGIFLTFIFAIFFLFLSFDGPADLSVEGYKAICLFGLCVVLWATNLIPLSITSLLVIGAAPLLGIMDASTVYSFFGNKAVFFILGAFILSAAMIACGLSARLTVWVLDKWGASSRKLTTSVYLFAAISSCFMSEHAVAAMLFPLVMEIVNILKLEQGKSQFAKSLFLALGWGCIIGGAMTALGGARVPLAVEILEQIAGREHTIGFLQYTALSFPLVLALLAGGWFTLMFLFKPEPIDTQPAREALHLRSRELGKLSFHEKGVGLVMVLTIFAWFIYGDDWGIANIAIVSIVALFSFSFINWKMVEEHVNWAIILMYGGAIALGEIMASTGAAPWLAKMIFAGTVESTAVFLIVLAILSTLFTTFMSNSAVIATLLPPAISMCDVYGISPALATMTIVIPSNFAFILPIATPASALAFSSRHISLREMIKSGLILSIIGMAAFFVLLFVYWPMIGFN
ncbi:MAG: DASS family sodium-coupled anion symporter [Candidatus Nitrohelix vancouverensis]|uniref:DASS family sodium-coupled anion symporter n=1 Tax=Candidatus Nitrohelix vancouverensis TaxID=2705534 RepID=A0A7T0G2K3_9BACT|nr:MAG: DASS family sodium-coupled anion symporter [Candidatus Nitrohelix vancouverensis]